MTKRRDHLGYPAQGLSPYAMGWVALALEGLAFIAIAAAALLAMWGLFGDRIAEWLPFLPPAAWSTIIAVVLLKLVMPWVHPVTRRVSLCPSCGKPTLLTSPDLDEWNVRANPNGHAAGDRRFHPEERCSQCHADLRKAA
ncbi:hypothetical protein [Sphingopyxis sp. NJF-3]